MITELRQALKLLDISQQSITGTRRMIFAQKMDPTMVMQELVEELRQNASYKKRLALFYLFNDIVQVAARDRIAGYIEVGSNVFLPEVSMIVQRLSVKERAPFLKTVDVWEERKLLSSVFLGKLRTVWQRASSARTSQLHITAEDISVAHRPKLINADPKLCDLEQVASRLSQQLAVSSVLANEITGNSILDGSQLFPCVPGHTPIPDPFILHRLVASLCSELNDLSVLLLATEAAILES